MSQHALLELITEVGRQRYRLAEKGFLPLGLTHTEARLLILLVKAEGEASQEALSAALVIDRSNVGRALKSLESKGYIARTASKTDKRAKVLKITDEGSAQALKIREIGHQIEQTLLSGLSETEISLALTILHKVNFEG